MVQIISNGKPIIIDFDDYKRIKNHKWYIDTNGYARRKSPDKSNSVYMHRFILGLNDPKILCDHINGIRFDNRKINLRQATYSGNARNRRPKSKYLGVTYQNIKYKSIKDGSMLTYCYLKAKIRVDNKLMHLGTFTDEVDAAKAYNEAAKKYFGEFANLNNV